MNAKARLAVLAALSVTSCATPAPAVLTFTATNAPAALAVYQAALGAAEQAELANPKLEALIEADAARAAPYVAAVQTAAASASTAPTLSALAADLLLQAAPYVLVSPKS